MINNCSRASSSTHALAVWIYRAIFKQESWGALRGLMGGPTGEFPAPWFANRGLVALSFPPLGKCSSGFCGFCPALLPVCSPSVATAVGAPRLKPDYPHWEAGHWQGGSGGLVVAERRGQRTHHIWLLCSTVSIITWDRGRDATLKAPWSRPKVSLTTMEMQRWSTRWKTKRWLMDSSVAAFVTLSLVLQTTGVSAGKNTGNFQQQMNK